MTIPQTTSAKGRIWIPQAIATIVLLWALNPDNPYGYYILLRWVCCGIFLFLLTKAVDLRVGGWAWVFGVMAGVYNPILRVHLNRDMWSVLNVITIIVTLVSIRILKPKTGVNEKPT
jgi:ABC-type xylose transport system permease subunit